MTDDERREKARERNRRWREAHREELREKARQWYAAHKEECIASARRWQNAHPEKVREQFRKYYSRHPEKVRERARRWHEANPDRVRENARRWRDAHREEKRERERRWWRENRAKPASALRLAVSEAFAAPGPESGGASMARNRLCAALLSSARAGEALLEAAAAKGGLGADPAEVAGCLAAMCLFTGADRWPEWGRGLVRGWFDAAEGRGPRWFVRRVRAAGRLAARLGAPQWAADAIGTPVREYYEGGADNSDDE